MASNAATEKPSGIVETTKSPSDDGQPASNSQDVDQRPKKGSRLRRFLWDSLDKSPEERAFVNKADWFIMSYVCIAYFVKYLDQTNVTNAYVSGMKEDIGMSGNNYNLLQTMFTSGYVIGNLASQLVMLKVRPSIWLPALEFIWSILVMAMGAAKNLETLLVLRFFIGLLEASAFPGILTLLGNWYRPEELGKRSSIFIATSAAGSMFSGYLQSALYSGMNGKHGIAAWRWLMIFDGIIGIPVSLYGFFAVPDSPTNTRAYWLNTRDREIAKQRMEEVGRKPPGRMTWRIIKESLSMWPMWLFPIAFACHVLGIRVYNYFNIYLKSTGMYSVQDVNNIPTGGFAYQIAMALIYAWVSDYYQTRWWVVCIACGMSMIGTIILSVYPEHNHAAMMAEWFMTYGETGAGALVMTMVNEACSFSSEHRIITIGWTEAFAYAMSAWVILFAYPSGDAPKFAVGYELATMFFAIEMLVIALIAYCIKRYPPGQKGSAVA